MKHSQFQQFYADAETMVRKTINKEADLEKARKRLLRTIVSEDASFTSLQLKQLFELAFTL